METTKIRVDYNYTRENGESGNGWEIFTDVVKCNAAVLHTIKQFAKSFAGKGYLEIRRISTIYSNDDPICDINQRRFDFDN